MFMFLILKGVFKFWCTHSKTFFEPHKLNDDSWDRAHCSLAFRKDEIAARLHFPPLAARF